MAEIEPGPFDGPEVSQVFEGEPIGDEDEVAPRFVAYFFLREMEHPKHGSHEKRVQDPCQYGGRSGVPHPPSRGRVPNKECEKRKPKQFPSFALRDAVFEQ